MLREYTEYYIDKLWKNRRDLKTFKIYVLRLDFNKYFIGFTGLLEKTNSLKPDDEKIYNIDVDHTSMMEYLFEGDFEKTKKMYVDLLESNCLVGNKFCNNETLQKIKNTINYLK